MLRCRTPGWAWLWSSRATSWAEPPTTRPVTRASGLSRTAGRACQVQLVLETKDRWFYRLHLVGLIRMIQWVIVRPESTCTSKKFRNQSSWFLRTFALPSKLALTLNHLKWEMRRWGCARCERIQLLLIFEWHLRVVWCLTGSTYICISKVFSMQVRMCEVFS